jgi:hypothetical protein
VVPTSSTGAVAWIAIVTAVAVLAIGCAGDGGGDGDGDGARPSTTAEATSTTGAEPVSVTPESFPALDAMTPVRGFFVDNVLGDLDATLAVARSADGGTYPPGSLIQLVPQEAMVKREAGFSPETNDWEFFRLRTSADGTEILSRGGAEVVNQFGDQSCAGCHAQADAAFDMVCEQDHGCDPIGVDRSTIEFIQQSDPRPVP